MMRNSIRTAEISVFRSRFMNRSARVEILVELFELTDRIWNFNQGLRTGGQELQLRSKFTDGQAMIGIWIVVSMLIDSIWNYDQGLQTDRKELGISIKVQGSETRTGYWLRLRDRKQRLSFGGSRINRMVSIQQKLTMNGLKLKSGLAHSIDSYTENLEGAIVARNS